MLTIEDETKAWSDFICGPPSYAHRLHRLLDNSTVELLRMHCIIYNQYRKKRPQRVQINGRRRGNVNTYDTMISFVANPPPTEITSWTDSQVRYNA